MKKIIPLRIQRIFVWIPYLNMLVQFMLLYNCLKANDSVKKYLKYLPSFLASGIFFGLIQVILTHTLAKSQAGQTFTLYIVGYVCPLLWGLQAVRFQAKNWKDFR